MQMLFPSSGNQVASLQRYHLLLRSLLFLFTLHLQHSSNNSLPEQGKNLLECNEPIQFFEAVYRAYEFKCLVKQGNIHKTQQKLFQFKEVTYDEMRCFIGQVLWTSLVQLSNRRSYFKLSKICQLPHFVSHMTRNRFEELFRMLHLAKNHPP